MSVKFRQAFHDTFVRTFCPSRSSPYGPGFTGSVGGARSRSMSQSYASMYQHNATARRFSDSQRRKQAVQQFDSDEHESPHSSDRYMLATAVVVLHPVNIVTHGIMKNANNGHGSNSSASTNTASGHKIMFSLIQEESEVSQTDEHLESE